MKVSVNRSAKLDVPEIDTRLLKLSLNVYRLKILLVPHTCERIHKMLTTGEYKRSVKWNEEKHKRIVKI